MGKGAELVSLEAKTTRRVLSEPWLSCAITIDEQSLSAMMRKRMLGCAGPSEAQAASRHPASTLAASAAAESPGVSPSQTSS